MIKYKLICKNCKISFDSWFSSSKEFEKLKAKKFLNCHNCNSNKVEKTLMAPKMISNITEKNQIELKNIKSVKISEKIKNYQKFIKNNFEYVGENFAYEARTLHYNNKNKEKGIYGTAPNDEVKELREEGIQAEIIPWIEDKTN